MQIAIIFEKIFQGKLRGAVWILETPENRSWFAQQTALESGSAVFTPESAEDTSATVLRSIWNVQEHYPDWSQITVSGVSLTPDLTKTLQDEGTVEETHKDFSLIRKY